MNRQAGHWALDRAVPRQHGIEGLRLPDARDPLSGRKAYIAVSNPERDARCRPDILGLPGEVGAAIEGLDARFI